MAIEYSFSIETNERIRKWYPLPRPIQGAGLLMISYPKPNCSERNLYVALSQREGEELYNLYTITSLNYIRYGSKFVALDKLMDWLQDQGLEIEGLNDTLIPATNQQVNPDHDLSWRAWRHNASGDCVCGIKRELCTYHK